MTRDTSRWVWDHSPLTDELQLLVHLAVAHLVDDNDVLCISTQHLADFATVSRSTVTRTLATLVQVGCLQVLERGGGRGRPTCYRLLTPHALEGLSPRKLRHGNCVTVSREVDELAEEEIHRDAVSGDAVLPGMAAPTEDPPDVAVVVTRHVFEHRQPRPAIPFPAVLQIARRLIDAGHEPERVQAVMLRVPTISVGWCEAELNRMPHQHAPIDDDRAAPQGRIRL